MSYHFPSKGYKVTSTSQFQMGHSNWYICVWDESTIQVIDEG